LTSLTGDADLLVTDDNQFQANQSTCVSNQLSTDSVVDSCPIPSAADYYIVVRGYTEATYNLTVRDSSAPPAADDPVLIVDNSNTGDSVLGGSAGDTGLVTLGRSRGGSLGLLSLFGLLLLSTRRFGRRV